MEFTSLDQIAFNQVTIELIADATALAFQVNNRRPLPTEVIEKILKDLLGERVYNSNAIEGNTLTLRETKRILDTGSIVDVGKKREATEVLNLGMAIEQLQLLVSDRTTWASLENLTRIHRTLMTDVLEYGACVFANWAGSKSVDKRATRRRTVRPFIRCAKLPNCLARNTCHREQACSETNRYSNRKRSLRCRC